jgi:hypothetical protein
MEFRIQKSTEFRGILRNSAELSTLNFRGIPRNSELKSLPHKIPYSAEFQKVTSVDTLSSTYICGVNSIICHRTVICSIFYSYW